MHDHRAIRITMEADVVLAQSGIRRAAAAQGFSRTACWELAVVASELATNILKYAGSGTIHVRALVSSPPDASGVTAAGLEIEALDDGPGFDDPRLALEDGVSEGRVRAESRRPFVFRGLGLGLGAVARLTDELDLGNRTAGGARVRVRRYLPSPGR